MNQTQERRFSGPVTVFHGRRLPETATPAGYSALIDAFDLVVPLPRTKVATGSHHRITETGGWRILTPRHGPWPSLETMKPPRRHLAETDHHFLLLVGLPGPVPSADAPSGNHATAITDSVDEYRLDLGVVNRRGALEAGIGTQE